MFLVLALTLAVLGSDSGRELDPVLAVGLLAAYVAVLRFEFPVGAGMVVPTQLVVVPMLLLLPPAEVPLLVGLAHVLDGARAGRDRLPIALADAWFVLGPALVLTLGGAPGPDPAFAGLFALAFAAQCVCDLGASSAREWLARGIPPQLQLRVLAVVWLVDAALAPVGFAAARRPADVLVAVPPILLLALLTRERNGRLAQAQERLREATTDELTGLANHRRFQAVLRDALAGPGPVSLILLDIDCFKAVNDTHGHPVGDQVLRAVAARLRGACRSEEEPARYGGEELAVVVHGDAESARRLAERARVALHEIAVPLAGGGTLGITASFGVAAARAGERDAGALVTACDAALYAAKRAGKDRVECA